MYYVNGYVAWMLGWKNNAKNYLASKGLTF